MMTSQIVKDLFNMQDKAYRDFHSRLIPSVEYDRIIGVRTPILRKYAKSINDDKTISAFLESLPHYYYEENNLHAFLLERVEDYEQCINHLDKFLAFVDNWATCDGLNPKCFKKNLDKLYEFALKLLSDSYVYKIRFGIVMLMKYYLDGLFDERYLLEVARVENDDYYVYMAKAWFFAEALVKQYDLTIKFFENRLLPKAVHNKAIVKATESYRISIEIKEYLKTLKY